MKRRSRRVCKKVDSWKTRNFPRSTKLPRFYKALKTGRLWRIVQLFSFVGVHNVTTNLNTVPIFGKKMAIIVATDIKARLVINIHKKLCQKDENYRDLRRRAKHHDYLFGSLSSSWRTSCTLVTYASKGKTDIIWNSSPIRATSPKMSLLAKFFRKFCKMDGITSSSMVSRRINLHLTPAQQSAFSLFNRGKLVQVCAIYLEIRSSRYFSTCTRKVGHLLKKVCMAWADKVKRWSSTNFPKDRGQSWTALGFLSALRLFWKSLWTTDVTTSVKKLDYTIKMVYFVGIFVATWWGSVWMVNVSVQLFYKNLL